MDRRAASLLLVVLALAWAAPALGRTKLTARCSACRAVASELVKRLEEEVPRNHLDMRHRLDKDGKRWGKVIDYKQSELRVIHLLEDLCDGMSDFELLEKSGQKPRWAKSSALKMEDRDSFNILDTKEHRKQLESYCHNLVEKHEDELSEALRNGEIDDTNASDFLCVTAAKHCMNSSHGLPPPPAPPAPEGEGKEGAAEAGAEGQAAQAETGGSAEGQAAAELEGSEGADSKTEAQAGADADAAASSTAGDTEKEEL